MAVGLSFIKTSPAKPATAVASSIQKGANHSNHKIMSAVTAVEVSAGCKQWI